VKEQTREVKAGTFFETLVQDASYAGRAFRHSPGFFVVVASTLSLGIGVTTALFSIVNAVLLRALPYPDPERIASLAEVNDSGHPMSVSYPDFRDWRDQNHSFQCVGAYGDMDGSVSNGVAASKVHMAMVTQDFFKVFGVSPVIGRSFSDAEHRTGAAPVVIISDSLWRGMYGSSPNVIGRTIKLFGGIPATVIGVLPAGFDFPEKSQLWTAAELTEEGLQSRTAHNFEVVGKLRPGVSLQLARQDVGAIARRIKANYPSAYQAKDAQVISLHERLTGPAKASLLMLLAAVGCVLVIVCVNVANLLLARGVARARELAIRGALGAGRGRLIRQLSIESLVLALVSCVAGVIFAWWTLHLLKYFVPLSIARIETVTIDGDVLLFAALVSLLSSLLFGIAPALVASRIDINHTLKQTSAQHTAAGNTRRIGNLLVISEIALAFVLLIGTGLMMRSFEQMRHQPSGFDAANVLTGALSFPVASLKWDPPPARLEHYQAIAARLRTIPGVRYVAYSSTLPVSGDRRDGHFWIEGAADLPGFLSDADYRIVSPDYFHSISARLIAGRFFSEGDGPSSMPVVVINSAMAKSVFPKGDAMGHKLWFDSFDLERRFMTIVGIVENIREDSPIRPPGPAVYVCYTQHPMYLSDTNLVLKVDSDPNRFAPVTRRVIQSIDKDVSMSFQTLDEVAALSTSRQRFETQMLALFAWLAVVLAGMGIYGVLSYQVQQARSEIGVRMALGANSRDILAGILSRGARAALLGALLGLPVILLIARLLSAMLYQVVPFDPLTYTGACIFLFLVVLLSSYLPARRATQIDPIHVLKYE
jgi:putative ABC transport system permease protein